MNSKKIFKILSSISILTFLPFVTKAVCPVCTIAIASGVGLCRYLGIDDLVSGLWVGGLLISMTIWLKEYLQKKNKDFKFSFWVILLSFFLITFSPLKLMNILGHSMNKIFGIDRLLFSSVIGSILVYTSIFINNWLKKGNKGKVYFPYQKVVIPLVLLLVFSFVFFYKFC